MSSVCRVAVKYLHMLLLAAVVARCLSCSQTRTHINTHIQAVTHLRNGTQRVNVF